VTEIIGVRFKKSGKTYYFAPGEQQFARDTHVIVETSRGLECGQVVTPNKMMDDRRVVQPLKPVVRLATPEDLKRVQDNEKREKDALQICEKKIAAHKLEMKLVDVECAFDGSKILFYFTADNRVDFRELVKDLASTFRTRIELRQIGVRDEAKMLGGLGICGRPFCCTAFLGGFIPVSIKMAKEQNLSLNPTKISGSCGRLMCCLKYEQEMYEELLKETPGVDSIVSTSKGRGKVVECSPLKGQLKVKLDGEQNGELLLCQVSEVKIIKNTYRPANNHTVAEPEETLAEKA